MKKNISILILLVLIIAIIILAYKKSPTSEMITQGTVSENSVKPPVSTSIVPDTHVRQSYYGTPSELGPWNTYTNEIQGFQFQYPPRTYIHAERSDEIVFNHPDGLASGCCPLARVNVKTVNTYSFPTVKPETTYGSDPDNPISGTTKLLDEKIIQTNPVIIELTWHYSDSFQIAKDVFQNDEAITKDYRVVDIHSDNSARFFDIEVGIGIKNNEEALKMAQSFRFYSK